MNDFEQRLQAIEQRNLGVEINKAWEVSIARGHIIAGMTYLTACLFLWLANVHYFYLSALVPMVGYVLSTLSLTWQRKYGLRDEELSVEYQRTLVTRSGDSND